MQKNRRPDLYLLTTLLDKNPGVDEQTLGRLHDSENVHNLTRLIEYDVDQALHPQAVDELNPQVLDRLQRGRVRWDVVLDTTASLGTSGGRFFEWFHSIRHGKGGSVHTFQMRKDGLSDIWKWGDRCYAPEGHTGDFRGRSSLMLPPVIYFKDPAEVNAIIRSHSPWDLATLLKHST